MRKYLAPFALVALFAAQFSFANEPTPVAAANGDDATFKQCETIAQSCKSAGFVRNGAKGKAFWRDCMRPIVAGKTVAGVTADPNDVKACRTFKIDMLQKKLDELKAAQ